MFSNISIFTILILALILGWAVWFVIGAVRYVASGDYDIDERLRKINR